MNINNIVNKEVLLPYILQAIDGDIHIYSSGVYLDDKHIIGVKPCVYDQVYHVMYKHGINENFTQLDLFNNYEL